MIIDLFFATIELSLKSSHNLKDYLYQIIENKKMIAILFSNQKK